MTKYSILTHCRSGSSLLTDHLNSHPHVHCLFEPMLRSRHNIIKSMDLTKQLNDADRVKTPWIYVDNLINLVNKSDNSLYYIGEKNVSLDTDEITLDYILNKPEWKKIILLRENLLDYAVSFLTASYTSNFNEYKTAKPKPVVSMRMDIKEVKCKMDRICRIMTNAVKTFHENNVEYEFVTYSDVVNKTAVYDIYNFIGVKDANSIDIRYALQKQIKNYDFIENIRKLENELSSYGKLGSNEWSPQYGYVRDIYYKKKALKKYNA